MTALLDRAEEAVRLASADARAARRLADEALRSAEPEARSVAHRAVGLAAVELGDADGAVAALRQAVSIADAAGLPGRAGEARMSLTWALALQGSPAEALAEADLAEPLLDGTALARLQMQRAMVLHKMGRLDEALDGYRRPLAAFRRAGDVLWEARLLCNRGVLHVYRGALGAAEADFERAEALHESIGQDLAATQVRENRGWVAARRGDFPLALEFYDRAEAEYRAHGVPLALLLMDRCEVLLSARLTGEARAAATRAAAELEGAGMGSDLAEALLLCAQAELLAGDAAAAREHATRADDTFTRQHRTAWSALARSAAARAAWLEAEAALGSAAGEAATAALAAAQRALRALEATGRVETLDARLIAGRAALALGRTRLARTQLDLAARERRRGPVHLRTRAWHAAALLRLSHGDRRGANVAVAAGLRALEAHQLALGATELRAQASGHGEELATLGLRLAVESGSARQVLRAAERRRAASLLLRPARPPDDAQLAAELEELRGVTAALDEALREGTPAPDLLRRQAALEESVRRRARRARGGAEIDERRHALDLDVLGDRALVELFQLDGTLHAVTVAGGRLRQATLGPADLAEKELASLRRALRTLAPARPGSRTQEGMEEVSRRIARNLDDALRAPLIRHLGDRPLVIVPTGALHALPWSMLPSLEQRPVTLAPSARLWQRAAAHQHRTTAPDVLVAGPGLPEAEREIAELQRRHPHARVLTGANATVAEVAHALDGADHAHIAAHGTFRDDNPQFCSLQLADGALTVYDLERLRRAPQRLVLSSCESGLHAVRAGDELMGFTAAMLALGTSTVIAAVVPVGDHATRELMLRLDESLSTGASPAEALVSARNGADTAARAAFACFGAG